MCVFVTERERETERDRETERETSSWLQPVDTKRSSEMCMNPRWTGRRSIHASSARNIYETHTQ